MTTVSPFARSSVFDEPRLGGREQTVRRLRSLRARWSTETEASDDGPRLWQIEEMYSVPESFLEIEVRNPQTHGECPHRQLRASPGCGEGRAAARTRREN